MAERKRTLNQKRHPNKDTQDREASSLFHVQFIPSIELGGEADRLDLPELNIEKIVPPGSALIKALCQKLQPVLDEIHTYIKLNPDSLDTEMTADKIAKGYLLKAINKAKLKYGPQITREKSAYLEFLTQLSGAMVEGVPAQQLIAHLSKNMLAGKDFDAIIQLIRLDYPSKTSLLLYFKSKELFSMAYKTSLLGDEDIEKGLCAQLQPNLLDVLAYLREKNRCIPLDVKDNQLSKLPKDEEVKCTTDLSKMLELYHLTLERLIQNDSKELCCGVLELIKTSPFFGHAIAGINEDLMEVAITSVKNLQLVLESANTHILSKRMEKRWVVNPHVPKDPSARPNGDQPVIH